jgi:hypothetical protein
MRNTSIALCRQPGKTLYQYLRPQGDEKIRGSSLPSALFFVFVSRRFSLNTSNCSTPFHIEIFPQAITLLIPHNAKP